MNSTQCSFKQLRVMKQLIYSILAPENFKIFLLNVVNLFLAGLKFVLCNIETYISTV